MPSKSKPTGAPAGGVPAEPSPGRSSGVKKPPALAAPHLPL